MKEEEIKKILEENKESFDLLEEYDRTGKFPKKVEENIKRKIKETDFKE